MKTVVQRVTRAQVRIGGEVVGKIGRGLALLVGVEKGDGEADADATARKIAALRIFPNRTPMDVTAADVGGACLVISQFTPGDVHHRGTGRPPRRMGCLISLPVCGELPGSRGSARQS